MGEFMEATFARFVKPKAKFSYNDAKKADKVEEKSKIFRNR